MHAAQNKNAKQFANSSINRQREKNFSFLFIGKSKDNAKSLEKLHEAMRRPERRRAAGAEMKNPRTRDEANRGDDRKNIIFPFFPEVDHDSETAFGIHVEYGAR